MFRHRSMMPKDFQSRLWRVAGLLAVLLAFAPWAMAAPSNDAPTTVPAYRIAPGDRLGVAITFGPASPVARRLVQPGDRLGFIYHIDIPDPDEPYRVEPGDQLYVQFEFAPDIRPLYLRDDSKKDIEIPLSHVYLVQPDGTLRMLGLDRPLAVAGRTVDEIDAMIEQAFAPQLVIPDCVVGILERQELKYNTLRQLFQPEEERPVSFLTQEVPDDGLVSLPQLQTIPAAGLRIEDIASSVTARYHALGYPLMTVNVFYDRIANRSEEQLRSILTDRVNPFSLVVLPDGSIALPLVASQTVSGLDVDEAGRRLTRYYRQARGLDRVEVSVWVEAPAGRSAR